jgi:TolB-like protein
LSTGYSVGEFEVRPAERRVLSRAGEAVPLGARAFDLLLALIERRDRVVGKDELLALVWPGVVVEENNLTVQVSALRKVLGTEAIATVPGRGYRFTLAVSDPAQPPRSTRSPSEVAADHGPSQATSRPSIAVLPFDARSDDVAIGFLADGLVEDVIAQLARVPGFLVIAQSSSFEFRRRPEGLPAIARALGVRYLVEGSLRQVGSRLLVSTHLVEAESARVLWSGRLESERDAAGDLQEAIARGVIAELEPELTRAEITLIRRRRPDDVDVWGHYHQGVGALALRGWTEEAVAEARAAFARALERDPRFALAEAHAALIAALGMTTGLLPNAPSMVDAVGAAAEHALTLEDGDSQVLGYAGCALSDVGQRERGAEILQRALAIDPSNAQAHVALGATVALQGRREDGIARLRHGMRISPRDRRLGFWGWALSQFLLRAGHPEEALEEARLAARRDARLHLARLAEANALQALGRAAEARAALATARRLRPVLTPEEVAQVHGKRMAGQLAPLWDDSGPSAA